MSSEPIRQPANDLIAFDISRQSPEQIAQLFARWKEQRKRLAAPAPQHRPPHLRPVPPVARGAMEAANEPVAEAATPQSAAEQDGPFRYSASFEALLTAPSLAQRVWNPNAGLQKLERPHPPRRRSRMKWVLAGAASVVAVAAVAGGALWERPGGTPAGTKPAAETALVASPAQALPATPSYPTDIPMMAPFAATVVAAGEADWPMRPAVDLALMRTAPVAKTAHLPLMPQVKPSAPVVQTASKPARATPTQAEANEAPIARVELPLVPSVTTATVSVPVAPAGDARDSDPRADGAVSRGNDKGNYTFGTNSRVASGKPAGTPASGGSAKPGSHAGGAGTGSSGDPSGGTGSAGTGSSGDPSGGTGGDPDGGTSGGGTGGGGTSGGDAGGDTSGGDAGSGDSGGAGGGAGGGDAGSGDSGGASGGGDAGGSGGSDSGAGSGGSDSGGAGSDGGGSGSGDSGGSGESGASGGSADTGGSIGGAIGGAVGGLGDAVGGALGGGKGAKSDQAKDKGKAKDKAN